MVLIRRTGRCPPADTRLRSKPIRNAELTGNKRALSLPENTPQASLCPRRPISIKYWWITALNRNMKHVVRAITHWALLTHIYVSSSGFTLAFLFGATGLTLNHQDFGLSNPRVSTFGFTVDKKIIKSKDQIALEQSVRQQFGIQSPS